MNLSYNLGMVSNMKQFERGEVKKKGKRRKVTVNCDPGNGRRKGNTPRVVGANREGEKILQIESKWWLSRLDRIRTN